jgi:hypothetical protein
MSLELPPTGYAWSDYNRWTLETISAEKFFDEFEAQKWIDEFRTSGADGRVDIDATAEKVGVPLFREMPVVDGNP